MEDPNNWRLIAILNITYNFFARLVYQRISYGLDEHQSEDQFGFRHSRSTTHALLVLESMLSKGIEYIVPVRVVTIDLKKVFDRVDHKFLFRALRCQMDHNDVALLEFYEILFNAVLEHAIKKWKMKLVSHGFCLHPDNEQDLPTFVMRIIYYFCEESQRSRPYGSFFFFFFFFWETNIGNPSPSAPFIIICTTFALMARLARPPHDHYSLAASSKALTMPSRAFSECGKQART